MELTHTTKEKNKTLHHTTTKLHKSKSRSTSIHTPPKVRRARQGESFTLSTKKKLSYNLVRNKNKKIYFVFCSSIS
jgi:hypothetical protein